jgi:hypothetical protein
MGSKTYKKLWVGGVLLLVIVLCAVFGFFRPTISDYGLTTEKISIGKTNTVIVEIVDSEASRAKGLMMRTFLPQGQGMLFVWPEEAPRTMWMKDTFISLDMIFIDADHDYGAVKKDLINYYPKLKKGGIFAGHDYTENCGVVTAVDEFAADNKLELNISRSSWILK